jgi:anti-anti-sigma factor
MEHPSTADRTAGHERLTTELTPQPRGTVVRVVGELDYDTAPELLRTLDRAFTDGVGGPVVIDCAGIAFCDSSGLNALLRARRSAAERGCPMTLAAPSRATLRVLQLTGADGVLSLASTVEQALAG